MSTPNRSSQKKNLNELIKLFSPVKTFLKYMFRNANRLLKTNQFMGYIHKFIYTTNENNTCNYAP